MSPSPPAVTLSFGITSGVLNHSSTRAVHPTVGFTTLRRAI
jgi:hypothetical protein